MTRTTPIVSDTGPVADLASTRYRLAERIVVTTVLIIAITVVMAFILNERTTSPPTAPDGCPDGTVTEVCRDIPGRPNV